MKQAILLLLLAAAASAQPFVPPFGVVNAASYTDPRNPSGGLARGSMFLIFGDAMGPRTLVRAASYPLPTALGGTSVEVRDPVTQVRYPCLMVYVVDSQLAAILPSGVPAGRMFLTVSVSGATSAPVEIRVDNNAFGIFTLNQSGEGPGVVQNVAADGSLTVNGPANAARPQQIVTIYGTGLGPVAGNEAASPLPGDLTNISPLVLVGGRPVQRLLYRGRSGCCAGVDQINFEIPDGVEGCNVPILVRLGNNISNTATVSVSPTGGACRAFNLESSLISNALNSGAINVGQIVLSRRMKIVDLPLATEYREIDDTGSASFVRVTRDQFSRGLVPLGLPSPDSCLLYRTDGEQKRLSTVFRAVEGLDAGLRLPVAAAASNSVIDRDLISRPKGEYRGTFFASQRGVVEAVSGFLTPGNYTIDNQSGGSEVGAFRTTITLPPPVNWTNRVAIAAVNRAEGVILEWGSQPVDSLVVIEGYSTGRIGENGSGMSFTCVARGNEGRFQVPPSITLAMPSTDLSRRTVGGREIAEGLLGIAVVRTTPLRITPGGLDLGVVQFYQSIEKPLVYR
jgi:uncharacterized protein (TIGR03437 family)